MKSPTMPRSGAMGMSVMWVPSNILIPSILKSFKLNLCSSLKHPDPTDPIELTFLMLSQHGDFAARLVLESRPHLNPRLLIEAVRNKFLEHYAESFVGLLGPLGQVDRSLHITHRMTPLNHYLLLLESELGLILNA